MIPSRLRFNTRKSFTSSQPGSPGFPLISFLDPAKMKEYQAPPFSLYRIAVLQVFFDACVFISAKMDSLSVPCAFSLPPAPFFLFLFDFTWIYPKSGFPRAFTRYSSWFSFHANKCKSLTPLLDLLGFSTARRELLSYIVFFLFLWQGSKKVFSYWAFLAFFLESSLSDFFASPSFLVIKKQLGWNLQPLNVSSRWTGSIV